MLDSHSITVETGGGSQCAPEVDSLTSSVSGVVSKPFAAVGSQTKFELTYVRLGLSAGTGQIT